MITLFRHQLLTALKFHSLIHIFKVCRKGFLLHPRDGEATILWTEVLSKVVESGQNLPRFSSTVSKNSVQFVILWKVSCQQISFQYFDLNGYFYKPLWSRIYVVRGPSGSDPLFGQKYLLSGFWNHRALGWFFQTKFEDELIAHGAVRSHA